MNINRTLKIIFGVVVILVVILLTIKFIKVLPAFVKVIALGANIATVYVVYDMIKKSKINK